MFLSVARFLPLHNNINVCEVNLKHLLSEIKTFDAASISHRKCFITL